ncbi:MAG: phosphoribosylanthranilate isomerase [Bryobacteraceae bacterium]|nr:phosphoribosylanthranilate isomerase [Bryobacteraceae bacterium]
MSVLVKICGITNADDALAAVEAGADALGLNFWPGSPRYVTRERARQILSVIPGGVLRVGVLVDETAAPVEGLDVLQIHGEGAQVPAGRWWRAIAAGKAIRETIEKTPGAEAFLVDTPSGQARGGTGRTFDWTLAAGLEAKVILAGGLAPENVADALAAARPWGVDACSRLERAPGVKDHARMRAFVRAVREWEERA